MNPSKTLPPQPGEIPWKEFVQTEADKFGFTVRQMRSMIESGKYKMDYSAIRRGKTGRAIAVRVK